MAQPNPQISRVARDPLWLPHRYDPDHDAVHFVHTPRETHRAVTFLTDEYLPADAERIIVRRSDAIEAAAPGAPVHFIFHSAFCCSTLLARAFDIEGVSMGLKEPVILNDLIGWRHRGADRRRVAQVFDHSLALLARPFAPGEAVVIKPSNVINGLAQAALALRPQSRALLLHAPLKVYLGSIAKKGMWGRLWVRDLLVKLLKEGLVNFGFTNEQYLELTDLQAAAVGWIAQQALFAQLLERFGKERIAVLDSETLMANPAGAVTLLAGLYELPLDSDAIAAIVSGPAFTRHSKFGSEFDGERRGQEQRDAAAIHGDEIDKVSHWAEVVAANAGVPLAAGTSLPS